MLEYDDEAGIIFDKNDSQDLISKIESALNWNYSIKSEKARNMIVKNLSKYVMAQNYTKIYRSSIERKGK